MNLAFMLTHILHTKILSSRKKHYMLNVSIYNLHIQYKAKYID